MSKKRFEIDSKMYGATDVEYWLKDNANELVDGYGDKIYWGEGSVNGLEQIVNKLNEFSEENKKLKEENCILKKSVKRQEKSNDECSKYIEEVVKKNEELQKMYKRHEYLIYDLKNEMKCQRKNVEKIFKEFELLQEECLDVVNIIEDARREIFEGQSYAGYDILENAIDKLQKIAYKGVY